MAGAAQAHQANLRARMRKRVAALCSGGKGGSAWIVYEGAYASLVGCDGRAILNTDDGPAGITHNDDHPMAGGALFQCACFVPGSGRQPDSLWVGTSAGRVRVYNASTGSLCTILIDGVGCVEGRGQGGSRALGEKVWVRAPLGGESKLACHAGGLRGRAYASSDVARA